MLRNHSVNLVNETFTRTTCTASTPPRISIVTPSFNQARYLEECMDSVLSQGYPNLEYVVMDGGSSDGSVEIIKKYEKYLTYWQSCPDNGQYAAINAGFAHTTGDIMAWLNSDDRYHPNTFLKVACAFSEYPAVKWITGRRTTFDENGNLEGLDRFTPCFSQRKILSRNFDKPSIMQETTFWRRELWGIEGAKLDTSYTLAADTELWIRFFRHTDLHVLDNLLGGFRHHGEQRSLQNIQKYLNEVEHAVLQELQRGPLGKPTSPNPSAIKISTGTYLDFADIFGIPRFKPSQHTLWRPYLHTVKEWIFERQAGLEAVSVFLDEIELWQDSDECNFTSVKNYLNKCFELKQHAENLIHMGETRFFSHDLDGALQATFEALDIWPTSAAGNINLGVLLYHRGKLQEAMECLMRVCQQNVSERGAFRNLAVISHELGQRDKVQWAMDYYLAWFPEDSEMELFYRRLLECH